MVQGANAAFLFCDIHNNGAVLIGNKPMGFFEIRYLLLTARVVLQHYCKQALMAVYVAKAA